MTFISTLRSFDIRSLQVALLGLSMMAASGCSGTPNPDGRENVSGSITLNGQPMPGMAGIVFAPQGGGPNDGGQGQLVGGSYSLTGANGVKPGKYIVRITASIDFDRKTGKPADNTITFGNEVPVDLLPPEFNKNSTIEFEVVAGKNNVFNYDVKTSFVPQMPKNTKTKEGVPL